MSAREGLDRGDGGGAEETDEEIDRRARRDDRDRSPPPPEPEPDPAADRGGADATDRLLDGIGPDNSRLDESGGMNPDAARGTAGPNTGLDRGDGGGPDPAGGGSGGGGRDETTDPTDPRPDATGAGTGQLRSGGPNDSTGGGGGGGGGGPTAPPEPEPQRPAAPTNPNVGLERGDGGGPDTDPGPRVDPDRTPVPEDTAPRRQVRGGFGAPTRGDTSTARPGERLGDSFIQVGGRNVEQELERAATAVDVAAQAGAERYVDEAAAGRGASDPVSDALGAVVAGERAALQLADAAGFGDAADAVRSAAGTDPSEGPAETTAEAFATGGLNVANAPDALLGALEGAEFVRDVNRRALTDRGRLLSAAVGRAATSPGPAVDPANVAQVTRAAAGRGPVVDREGAAAVGSDVAAVAADRVAAAQAAPFETGGRLAGGAAVGAGAGLAGGAAVGAAARAGRLPDLPDGVGRRAVDAAREFRGDTRGQVSTGRQRSGGDSDSSGESSGGGPGDLGGVTGRDPTDTFGTRGRAVGGRRTGEPSVGPGRARTTDLERQAFGEAARRGSNVPGDDLRRVADVERRLSDATEPEDLDRRRTPPGVDEDTSLPDPDDLGRRLFQRARDRDRVAGSGGAAGGLLGTRGTGIDPTDTALPRGDELGGSLTAPGVDTGTDAGTGPALNVEPGTVSGTTPGTVSGTAPDTDTPTVGDTVTDPDQVTRFVSPPSFRFDGDGGRRPDPDADGRGPLGGSGPAFGTGVGFSESATFGTGFQSGGEILGSVFGSGGGGGGGASTSSSSGRPAGGAFDPGGGPDGSAADAIGAFDRAAFDVFDGR